MAITVISSTPSPYARKVRINLIEQGIPFTLQTEVPWNTGETKTPDYNPLEKLPILIIDGDNDTAPPRIVYDSAVILDFLNVTPLAGAKGSLIPTDPEQRLAAKQLEALADGVCDSLILNTFEARRDEGKRSAEWEGRQTRKVEGGVKALDEVVRRQKQAGSDFLVGHGLTIADLAAGSLLGFMNLRNEVEWKDKYPALVPYWEQLEKRESFKQSVPVMFELKDKIVG